MAKDKDAGKSTKVEPVSEQLETVKEEQADETVGEAKTKETVVAKITDVSEVQKKEGETSKPQTAKEKAKEIVDEFTRAAKAKQEKDAAFIAPYTKAYPGERAFHVTSDNQVFLERDRGLAVLHQNSLANGKTVQTVKIK